MFALGSFRNQLLYDHVNHCASGKRQQIGQYGGNVGRQQNRQDSSDWFYDAAQCADAESANLLFPSLRRGMETMAPSGKFCMAIPKDKANAPAMGR